MMHTVTPVFYHFIFNLTVLKIIFCNLIDQQQGMYQIPNAKDRPPSIPVKKKSMDLVLVKSV